MSLPSDDEGVTQGFAAVPNWMLRDTTVDRNVIVVYLVLSSRMDRDGVSFPGQERIAVESGTSVATVRRTLRKMQQMGLVEVTTTRTPTGRRNIYRLLVHPFLPRGMRSP